MNKEELQDIAMKIATGNSGTESFSWDEFYSESLDITEYAWEPFEYWNQKQYNEHVTQIAEDIIRNFKHLIVE